jgi:hypothetical protein
MLKFAGVSSALLACSLAFIARAQNDAPSTNQSHVIVTSTDKSSNTVIAIPPDTSWTGTISFRPGSPPKKSNPGEAATWLQTQIALNGLQSTGMHPWHIVISYDQFNDHGDKVHSGVVEERWAAPRKYTVTYKSDTLNQTDYVTDHGLYRLGDQRWPSPAEAQVRAEVLDPFSHLSTLQDFHAIAIDRTFGPHTLHCVGFEKPGGMTSPDQYCFDADSSVLRYVRGEGWNQTAYNDITQVEGRNIAHDVEVTDGGHPFLMLQVKLIEPILEPDEKDFTPPAEAVALAGQRVTGVAPKPLQTGFPEWPTSLLHQHFTVTLQIVIGKDGRVTSAQGLTGPPEAFKAAEAAARKWRYQPYLVAGEPTEVETKIQFQNQ